MRIRRDNPVPLEEGIIECRDCGQQLAVVHALGDAAEATFVWRPPAVERDGVKVELASECHGTGMSAFAAQAVYHRGGCDLYTQATVDDYYWPEREPVLGVEPEPVVVEPEQLEMA